ncbi:MAG: gliding motility protein GldM, partial [Bacteroidia bacterium]|nr:gliding motility protein GldM [Bacteroidia bacterium]
MAGGKLPPRQKMINMMYLVLTALLALNVSKDILKAFHMVDVSMKKSGRNIEAKNARTMEIFKKQMADFPAKTKPFYDKANEVQKISSELNTYLATVKGTLMDLVDDNADGKIDPEDGLKKPDDGNIPTEEWELAGPDNIEKHANYMMKKEGGKYGKELRSKIEETKKKFDKIILDVAKLVEKDPKEVAKEIKISLDTEDPPSHGAAKQTWESEMFEHAPLAAVVTMITKIQNDCKNAESQLLDLLLKSINANEVSFDQLRAAVIPTKGTFILIGNQYEADIFIAASSSKQDAEILVDGAKVPVEGGIGKYKISPSSEGEGKKKVIINVKDPSGKMVPYESEITYTAFKGVATISADKMNVLYVGLENPVSVSVPGTSPDQLIVTASGGAKLSGSKGKYNISLSPGGAREVEISASIKSKDGSVKKIESKKYRVKDVPSPTPMIGAISNPTASASEIKAAPVVRCD